MFNLDILHKKIISMKRKIRAVLYYLFLGFCFKSIGVHCKIFGSKENIKIGANVSIGDFCWIEAINKYGDKKFSSNLLIGSNVALSDFVHISCVESIVIGDGTLIGSKVYIGDHSHGTYSNKLSKEQLHILPSKRELGDIKPIKIGTNCWIGDNVVILAGSQIGNGCVIAANSVIKGSFPDFSTIAGIPAKKVKELSE